MNAVTILKYEVLELEDDPNAIKTIFTEST